MIALPPVESVGKLADQIVEAHLTIAASSITNKERDSERPASSEVGMDSIKEPLINSIIEAVPSSPILPFTIGTFKCSGKFLYMYLIFFKTFFATESLMEMIFTFLFG